MSNLYFLKLENLLSVNNENLKKINLSVLNANEQGQTVFSNIDSSITVSYTHLDVYKRQPPPSSPRGPASRPGA